MERHYEHIRKSRAVKNEVHDDNLYCKRPENLALVWRERQVHKHIGEMIKILSIDFTDEMMQCQGLKCS